MALLLAGCTRNPGEPARDEQSGAAAQVHEGIVTISGDDTILESLTWRAPAVEIPPDGVDDALERAGQALDAGNLATDAESAVPLFLALSKQAPDDPRVDRKSTRLNSSHVKISYAVFCLKKKK